MFGHEKRGSETEPVAKVQDLAGVKGMNVLDPQTVPAILKQSAGDLQGILEATEQAVNHLVGCFKAVSGHMDAVVRSAAAIARQVEDEAIQSVRSGVEGLGGAATELVRRRARTISETLEIVTAEGELLRQLSTVTDGQAKIALTIKALTVHTKIEIGHLGAVGAGFDYLAHELDDFSRSLAQSTDKLICQTENRRTENMQARSILITELPRLYENMTLQETRLHADLEQLNSGLDQLASVPPQFRLSTEEITCKVAAVVVAFQAHDITRQQIEHVRDSLKTAAELSCFLPLTGDSQDIANVYACILIQISQLRSIASTIASWTTQIRRCMECIFAISSASLGAIGPLVMEHERMMTSQLSDIERIEEASLICSSNIGTTLSGISGLSQLVTEELKTSEFARNRLRMLTFNSVIEASGLGSRADTICVIADGISEVSIEWTRIAQISGDVLRRILVLAEEANVGMRSFSADGDRGFLEMRDEAALALAQLHTMACFTARESEEIASLSNEIRAESQRIAVTCDLLDACFRQVGDVEKELESLRRDMASHYPGIEHRFNVQHVEHLYATAYTTECERDVLRAALYGTVMTSDLAALTGNDVELF